MATGPSYFCGDKSNQKRLSAERLLCRTWPLPGKSDKTWYAKVSRLCCAAHFHHFSKTCFSPATAHAHHRLA